MSSIKMLMIFTLIYSGLIFGQVEYCASSSASEPA